MSDLEFFTYLIPGVVVSIVMGLAWGEYRGYKAAQKDLLYLRELVIHRLAVGDHVLLALEKGEKVTVITSGGQTITNVWMKDAKQLKPEDWEAIEATTSQLRIRAESKSTEVTKANKRRS